MKPSIPQGTRDFSAQVVQKRQYILQTIRTVFELYGFQPLETPAMENIDTLMGKYGEEGDKLIFKIINNGLDNPNKEEKVRVAIEDCLQGKWNKNLTERALRYDLTIPFARYVAINHGSMVFPFKRYQIQPVWRADRPQRGRYREFYQCDCDVVGSGSLLNEIELIHIYQEVFKQLGINVTIKINNRKILAALAKACGGEEKLIEITIAIDKLDKIGLEKVKEELLGRGLETRQIEIIEKYLAVDGTNEEKLEQIANLLNNNELAKEGLDDLGYLLTNSTITSAALSLDFTLARGLNYYTGTIFEIKANEVKMGSIGGGGRYDDLTGLFGVPGIPGVGISFGVDRIYDVMEELGLFEEKIQTGTELLFFNLGIAESKGAYICMQLLRNQSVKSELFHEAVKFDKQFKYAERKHIPYIAIIGTKELADNTVILKNLKSGEQQTYAQTDLKQMVQQIKTLN